MCYIFSINRHNHVPTMKSSRKYSLYLRLVFVLSAVAISSFKHRNCNDGGGFVFGWETPAATKRARNLLSKQPRQSAPPKELFSVAPMMGHTNRHYRCFFRRLSSHAYLYTEMIPSTQITLVYEEASKLCGLWTGNDYDSNFIAERVLRFVNLLRNNPQQLTNILQELPSNLSLVLQELLHPDPGSVMTTKGGGPVVLQLGGRDPIRLAQASKIGAAFGFNGINLNCGCPSTSVASGLSSGAALMEEPEWVAHCVEQMSIAIDEMDTINELRINTELSVKHRLGVAYAHTYDAKHDREQSDEQAYQGCRKFVEMVGLAGNVSKVHVHARLAILGLADLSSSSSTIGKSTTDASPLLWTPQQEEQHKFTTTTTPTTTKINHKRIQYRAKQQARQATIENRNIPPLRAHVVERIASDYHGRLQVITNGGISSMDQLLERTNSNHIKGSATNPIAGAMVGRAAINHPCSFANVDAILWKDNDGKKLTTRRQVLETYMDYCQEQEHELIQGMGKNHGQDWKKETRKKLVAPAFHLFMGEEGNSSYQRRLRKLTSRGDRHTSVSMLGAAMAELPRHVLDDKAVHDHVPWNEIEQYDGLITKRSGSMQRTIY